MKFEEIRFQEVAAERTIALLEKEPLSNPVIVIPTGGGKTVIMCKFLDKYLSEHPDANILILSHVKEILEQNAKTLVRYYGDMFIGVYSAGLDTKEKKKITVAGIQSIFRNPDNWQDIDLVLIDECHLINHKDEGMYRTFLQAINTTCVGLTASPFRLGHGMIYEGEDVIFDSISFDMTTPKAYAYLFENGFLTPLIPKKTEIALNPEGVKITAGDFNEKALADKFDRNEITKKIVNEVCAFKKLRKKWLFFAIDIKHAKHIQTELENRGVIALLVHSKMPPSEREENTEAYRNYKGETPIAIVNVNILTTGFDVPDIDLIAMMRPTKSPVLHVQTLGRGMRVFEGKKNCLVLDFGGNTERLGPIDQVNVIQKEKKKNKDGQELTKTCPECFSIISLAFRKCPDCGYEFPIKHNMTLEASDKELVTRDSRILDLEKGWFAVDSVAYSVNNNKFPPSIRVDYFSDYLTFTEWVCVNHQGYPYKKAIMWFTTRNAGMVLSEYKTSNMNMETLVSNCETALPDPKTIRVKKSGKFFEIIDATF